MERSPGPINVLLWGWVRLLLLWCYSLWVCAISFAGVLKEHLQFCQTEVHSFFRIKGLGFGKVAELPTVCWFFSPLTRAADRHQSNLSPGLLPWKRETERESERKNERCGREYRAEVIESWLSSQAFLASLKHIRRNTLSMPRFSPFPMLVSFTTSFCSLPLSLLGTGPGQCSCQSQLTNTSCNTLSAFKNVCFLLSNCSSAHVVRSFKPVQAVNLQGCCEWFYSDDRYCIVQNHCNISDSLFAVVFTDL